MLKFSCEKTLLQQAVSTVSRAVAAKSSIPALEGVLLEGDTQLTLSGYNMQTGIRTAVSAEIHQEGRIVLNAPAVRRDDPPSARRYRGVLRRREVCGEAGLRRRQL